ncbi:MAG: glycosyltransferase family 39 protein, partial [Spirochaetota bacterium]
MKTGLTERLTERHILCIILTCTFIFRLLTLEIIEDSGDGMYYWRAAQQLSLGLPYGALDHWKTRFGLILPVLGIIRLFGSHPAVYYILPITMALIQSALLYRLVYELYGRSAGLVSVALLVLYPEMIRASSQLLPGIFSGTWVLASLFFMHRSVRSERGGILYLAASALMMFIAYETKITNLFYAPGAAVFLLVSTRSFKAPVIWSSALLGLFIIECILYHHFTGDVLARAHAIAGEHLESRSLRSIPFYMLFYRWVRPGPLFMGVLGLSFWAVFRCIKEKCREQGAVILLPLASFIILLTFSVKSINPLVQAVNTQ